MYVLCLLCVCYVSIVLLLYLLHLMQNKLTYIKGFYSFDTSAKYKKATLFIKNKTKMIWIDIKGSNGFSFNL